MNPALQTVLSAMQPTLGSGEFRYNRTMDWLITSATETHLLSADLIDLTLELETKRARLDRRT